ncbi:hypothetical protein [Hugenholtzia roseola]|uniref:hypothetical protein n=1 Tax=Hugenholtzia roseola TaxID=1002 RepID=UPI0003F5C269|nr:hypothetical protein [Hugenholtzia roseola]
MSKNKLSKTTESFATVEGYFKPDYFANFTFLRHPFEDIDGLPQHLILFGEANIDYPTNYEHDYMLQWLKDPEVMGLWQVVFDNGEVYSVNTLRLKAAILPPKNQFEIIVRTTNKKVHDLLFAIIDKILHEIEESHG